MKKKEERLAEKVLKNLVPSRRVSISNEASDSTFSSEEQKAADGDDSEKQTKTFAC